MILAATHGKNGRVFVDGYDISAYLKSFNLDYSCDLAEIPGFSYNSKKYIVGLQDAQASGDGVWDGGTTAIDAILDGVKSSESIWSYYPGGYANGEPGYGFKALRTAYGVQVSKDEAVNFSVAAQCSEYQERIKSIGGLTTLSVTGNSAVLDLGASGAGSNGATIYFHAIARSGTILLQVDHSTNNSVWSKLTDLVNVSAIGAQRVTVAGTVNRYIRIATTLDGGESITFLGGIKVN